MCEPPGLLSSPTPSPSCGTPFRPVQPLSPDTASPQEGLPLAPSVRWERGGGQLGRPCSHRGATRSLEGQREDWAASSRGGRAPPCGRLRAPACTFILPAEATVHGLDSGCTAISHGGHCPGQSQPQNLVLALTSGPVSTSRVSPTTSQQAAPRARQEAGRRPRGPHRPQQRPPRGQPPPSLR